MRIVAGIGDEVGPCVDGAARCRGTKGRKRCREHLGVRKFDEGDADDMNTLRWQALKILDLVGRVVGDGLARYVEHAWQRNAEIWAPARKAPKAFSAAAFCRTTDASRSTIKTGTSSAARPGPIWRNRVCGSTSSGSKASSATCLSASGLAGMKATTGARTQIQNTAALASALDSASAAIQRRQNQNGASFTAMRHHPFQE